MTTGKTIALTRRTFVGKVMSLLHLIGLICFVIGCPQGKTFPLAHVSGCRGKSTGVSVSEEHHLGLSVANWFCDSGQVTDMS